MLDKPFLSFSQTSLIFAAELSIDCFKSSETNDSDFKISDCLTLYDFGDFNFNSLFISANAFVPLFNIRFLYLITFFKAASLELSADNHCIFFLDVERLIIFI